MKTLKTVLFILLFLALAFIAGYLVGILLPA